MLLKISRKIWLLQSITHYPRDHHRTAFPKFTALWIISILPILFAFVASRYVSADGGSWGALKIAFQPTDQFVFAAAFIAPILYSIVERHDLQWGYIQSRKRSPHKLTEAPKGYGVVLLISLIVFASATFVFSFVKALPVGEQAKKLEGLALKSSLAVYVYGLFCWYLSILMSTEPNPFPFVEENRTAEDKLKSQFSDRVSEEEPGT